LGSLDLSDEPDKPMRAMQPDSDGADRDTARPRELPDPDERGRAHDSARTNVSAETSAEASPGRRPETGDQRSYWDEVPRFQKAWAEHAKHRPERPNAGADRSGDRPELPAATAETVSRIRNAEPALSIDALAIEPVNKHGGWLAGFRHRLKDEGRLKEKIAEGLATSTPDATASQVLRLIPDAIRYTYCFQPENYTRGFYDIKERLEGRGYEMYHCKNWWTNPEYKGINTRWVNPEGQRFEVQFHTPESFHAKHHLTHLAYERIRNTATSKAELRELHEFQKAVSSWVQVPDGAADIPDYKKDGF
jgi:hypothetical protein